MDRVKVLIPGDSVGGKIIEWYVGMFGRYAGGLYRTKDWDMSYQILCITTERNPIGKKIDIDNLEPIEEVHGSKNKVIKHLTSAVFDFEQNHDSKIHFIGDLAKEIQEKLEKYKNALIEKKKDKVKFPMGYQPSNSFNPSV